MRVFVLDNYDSFTYNLVQALQALGARVEVVRSDRITVSDVLASDPTHVLISPGPGGPREAGISVALAAEAMERRLPLLGVCLGHQAIAVALGGRVDRAPTTEHGKSSDIQHDGRGLFRGLPNPMTVGRYHSLAVAEGSLPAALEVSARTRDGVVMAFRHRDRPAWGVQFHPESILTPDGDRLLANWLAAQGT